MTRINHMIINSIVLHNPWAVLGGILPDIFFIPVDIYDFYRKYKKLSHRELNNFFVYLNWFCHSFWFVVVLGYICEYFNFLILWQGYILHIIIDICTHTGNRALKLLYPISNIRFDILKTEIKGLELE